MRQKMARALCLLSSLVARPSTAMHFERVGSDLYAKGEIVDADFLAFQTQLEKPGLSRLILVTSPGGNLWTGFQWPVRAPAVCDRFR